MDLTLGHTQEIIKEAKSRGLLRNELAYVLATAYWETAHTMKPVKEAYWLSEEWRKKNLRYYPWYGRGFVQLTWEANYKKASDKLGINLVANKDLALDPVVAAKVLIRGMIEGWFTGKKLSDYINLQKSDYVGARRVINGIDKKEEIAKLAVKYETDLKAAGYGSVAPEKSPESVPTTSTPTVPEAPKPSVWSSVFQIIALLFKGKA